MSKLIRPLMYGSIGLVAISIGAVLMFNSGTEQPVTETSVPEPVTPAPQVVPETETDLEFGDGPISLTPVVPPFEAPTVEATPAPVETEPQEPEGPLVVGYKMKSGDILGRVANRYGCSVADIYRLNKDIDASNAHKIREGKVVLVLDVKKVGGIEIEGANPKSQSAATVQATPTVTGPILPETATPAVPPAAPKEPEWAVQRTHNLKVGDTYFDLSKRYYGTIGYWKTIRDANPQWRVLETVEGMEIVIPAINREDRNQPSPQTIQGNGNGGGNIIPPMRG